jgi:GGDEF domain-containing protein
LATIPRQAAQYVESVVQKVQDTLSTVHVFDSIHHHGSASVSAKLFFGGDLDPDKMLKEADAAMYEIKKRSVS